MSKRIPSLNWLRVFEAAARTESFARAAERLAMSPPAVSQQIRALEEYLGQALFTRAAAGVILTEAGRSLLVVVSDAIGKMETAAAELSAQAQSKLVLGVSLTFAAGWLSPRLPKYLANHPTVELELHSLIGRPETPPRHAELWIAFGAQPPGTEAHRLFGERLIPVAHADIAERIHKPEDMLSHTIISVQDHRRNWLQVLNRDHWPETTQTMQVDTTFAALSLASEKVGLALARSPASDGLLERFDLVPCLPGFALGGVEDYLLLCPTGVQRSKEALAFQEWILAEAQISSNT